MSLHLERELDQVKKKLLVLSSLVEQNLSRAVKALSDRNEHLAQTVQEGDREVDLKEVEVEEDCLKILALYQPVAIDLRIVIAILKINNDLERIGDLACNIARRARYLCRQAPMEIPFDYNLLVDKVKGMLSSSLEAFVQMDLKLANLVLESDDEVDEINREAYNLVYYGIRENPNMVEAYIHYLTVSRNLERIADYATNIAEDVIYMIEGKIIRHGVAGVDILKTGV